MKIDKNKITLALVLIWIVTFFISLNKFLGPNILKCSYEIKEKLYSNKIEITVNYRKEISEKIKYKETFISKENNLLELQKDDYNNKKYKVNEKKDKLIATLEQKDKKELDKIIKDLEDAGFKCK
jgi:hypothetical protein